ncbi:efflux RND transporter periplasmic adaptor subunit [Tunturiibacter empetritectus]|uniref:RND family efflux transporter MFP subunit n=1 Tax=Tunturiibacter lichenicola TaxID=2051959 RepID=A0A852V5V8_9BACT|nr:efflux RND transporter periplasmic adaptor subunit [Edaphobacter lichenicola]NYF88313.1 RND family efflux transporter MFP subunit [Edaphobacter lichenicola]
MKRLFAVMIAAAGLLVSLGCAPSKAQLHAAPVQVAHSTETAKSQLTKRVPPPHELVVSGPITLEQQLDIVALRSGVIVMLPVDVDTVVQKGQLLAGLDARQLEADRNTARYKVESLEADLKNWQSELQVRETDMRRAEAMHKEGITTQEAYDHSRYEVAASQFEVERQRGEMLSAKANLQSIDLELEKTRFVAPFKGVVAQRYVRLGQYVTTGDKLFRVMGASPLEVRFTLPGAEAVLLKRGDLVTVSATPEFQQTTAATVTHVSPVVDPGSGTIEVTAVLKSRLPGLIPGTVASVRIAR